MPRTVEYFLGVDGFTGLEARLEPDKLVFCVAIGNMVVEIGWARNSLDLLASTDEALLIAMKKVVQGVLPRVIIGV